MTDTPDFAMVVDQVKTMQRKLEGAGWVVANAVGEQMTPDGVIWFAASYVYGEYTATASYRPSGVGTAQGTTRVRITPRLVQTHPRIGVTLAQELIDAASEKDDRGSIEDIAWPPPTWAELAR